MADVSGNVVHRGAPSQQIESLLRELIKWYNQKNQLLAISFSAIAHNQFEVIHPFSDGNGRVGRLLLNNILLKYNLPPLNIGLKNRTQYYASMQAYEKTTICDQP